MPAFNVSNEIENGSEVVAAEHQQNYTEIEGVINASLVHSDGYNGMDTNVNLVQGADATVALGSVTKQQLEAYVAASDSMPVGAVLPFSGDAAPGGYALADGAFVSKAANPVLYALYGADKYGTDTGTDFALPNLQGKVPVGFWDGGLGYADTVGKEGGDINGVAEHAHGVSHSHGDGSLATASDSHSHTSSLPVAYAGGGGTLGLADGNVWGAVYGAPLNVAYQNTNSDSHSHDVTGTTASYTGNTSDYGDDAGNLQPYLVLNFIVKLG